MLGEKFIITSNFISIINFLQQSSPIKLVMRFDFDIYCKKIEFLCISHTDDYIYKYIYTYISQSNKTCTIKHYIMDL